MARHYLPAKPFPIIFRMTFCLQSLLPGKSSVIPSRARKLGMRRDIQLVLRAKSRVIFPIGPTRKFCTDPAANRILSALRTWDAPHPPFIGLREDILFSLFP